MAAEQHAHSQDKAAAQERARKPEERSPETAAPENLAVESIQKARLDPNALTSIDLARLQRKIGNRAASGLVGGALQRKNAGALQRVDDEPAPAETENPLTVDQVDAAITFYLDHSAQYTLEVTRQIQAAVGAPESGFVDEDMIQGVARFQSANPPLAVTGKADERTLPALIPGGLAEHAGIEAYTEEARAVIEGIEWPVLSVDERAEAILVRVNERLVAAGVPVVDKVVQALDPHTFGLFAFTVWSIRINEALLTNTTLTTAQAADLASTMYHEARHAEQWYRMAQLMAGQGSSSADIASRMSIPNRIAVMAFFDPIAEDSAEAVIADGWFQSVYGTGSVFRRHALGATGSYEDYRSLPEETDAWRVGTSVSEAYTAGAAAPAPAPAPAGGGGTTGGG